MLSEPTIQELRQILKEDYGLDVSFNDAVEIARVLTSYYEIVLKVYTRQAISKSQSNSKVQGLTRPKGP